MENNESKLVRGLTYLESPLKNGKLRTIFPGFGPNTYQKVGQEILAKGQELQTGYETSVFLGESYKLNESETKDVQNKMNSGWIWVYQTNFWLPEKWTESGMYSVHDSKALGKEIEFNRDLFESLLDTHDTFRGIRYNPETGVAFAPKSTIYLEKEKDWDKFAINGLNIALFSPEGAQNMAKLGKDKFNFGYTWGVIGNKDVKSWVSAVDGDRLFDSRLDVIGTNRDDYNYGYSWGKAAKQLQ